MEYVQFGATEFKVSHLALGCMSMSGAYGPADDNESIATLHQAFDLGINFIDTSASYGSGHNHELIAKALKGRRERIVIHSKSGSPRAPDASGMRSGSTPEYLTQNCEQSVKRLGIDALDVFCMSRVDPDIPVEESVGAMAKLVERGLTRYIGLSEASANSIRRARKVHPIASLQMEYSPWSRDPEGGNIQACREFNMGFMAYSPLGRGFFAGVVHDAKDMSDGDGRNNHPRFQSGNLERNLKILSQVRRDGERERRHTGAVDSGLVDGARQRHYPDPEQQDAQSPGRKYQGDRDQIDARRYGPAGCDSASGRGGGAAQPGHASGQHLGVRLEARGVSKIRTRSDIESSKRSSRFGGNHERCDDCRRHHRPEHYAQ